MSIWVWVSFCVGVILSPALRAEESNLSPKQQAARVLEIVGNLEDSQDSGSGTYYRSPKFYLTDDQRAQLAREAFEILSRYPSGSSNAILLQWQLIFWQIWDRVADLTIWATSHKAFPIWVVIGFVGAKFAHHSETHSAGQPVFLIGALGSLITGSNRAHRNRDFKEDPRLALANEKAEADYRAAKRYLRRENLLARIQGLNHSEFWSEIKGHLPKLPDSPQRQSLWLYSVVLRAFNPEIRLRVTEGIQEQCARALSEGNYEESNLPRRKTHGTGPG